jgi:TolB protein
MAYILDNVYSETFEIVGGGSSLEFYFNYSRIHDINASISVLNVADAPVDEETVQKENVSWGRCKITFSSAPADDYIVVVQGAIPKFVERIFYNHNGTGFQELYSMNPDGSDIQQITSFGATTFFGVVHPKGDQILFVSTKDTGGNGELYSADITYTGLTNVTRLTIDASYYKFRLSVSPDGTRIVYRTNEGLGAESIKKANYDYDTKTLSGVAFLRNTSSSESVGLGAFSPDGNTVVFHTGGFGTDKIRTINFDGTNESSDYTGSTAGDFFPAWSPDGALFVLGGTGDVGSDQDVILLNADNTGGRTDLTQNTSPSEYYCNWSPDGQKIVVGEPVPSIHTIDRDGSNYTEINTVGGNPSWGRLLI